MPTYDYECENCKTNEFRVKSINDWNTTEYCSKCGQELTKLLNANVHFIGTSVQHAEFNPAFGQIVKNKYHRSELAKQHNVVEIGNDNVDNRRKDYAKEREAKRRAEWEKM